MRRKFRTLARRSGVVTIRQSIKSSSSNRVAWWSLFVSALALIGVFIDVYQTHFQNSEHLEAGVVEYRFSESRKPGEPLSPYIDLVLVNRGDLDARYTGSILHVNCPPGSDSYFPLRPVEDTRVLIPPKSISGTELIFEPFTGEMARKVFAEAGLDTTKAEASFILEVRAIDTHGKLLSGIIGLRKMEYWKSGVNWEPVPTDSLLVEVIPGGVASKRAKGGFVFWESAGFSWNPDGSIRNVTFYPDSTLIEK